MNPLALHRPSTRTGDGPAVDGRPRPELDRQDCLVRLATAVNGRLAVTDQALPLIVPVQCRLVEDVIVFHNPFLPALPLGTVVALECGPPVGPPSWSVCAAGRVQRPGPCWAAEVAALRPDVLHGWDLATPWLWPEREQRDLDQPGHLHEPPGIHDGLRAALEGGPCSPS